MPPALTPAQIEAVRRKAQVHAARLSLIDFVRFVFPGYQAGWFHFELCAKLEAFSRAVAERRSPRLIVSVPPRHGKSLIVSQLWPIWHMAQHARTEFVCASFAVELSSDHSRAAREYARGPEVLDVFPHIAPKEDDEERRGRRPATTDRLDKWALPNGSQFYAVGVGGPLTGKGATILSIDDPIKGWEEAESPTQRRKMHAWYQSVARTRLAPGAGIVIVQTRWHEDDLAGFVLKREVDPSQLEPGESWHPWEVVNYPALAEQREKYRRPGDALHPDRYTRGEMLALRRDLGERIFGALYQGRPSPAGGSVFKREWFGQVYETDPRRLAETCDEVLISYDCAAKKGDANDYTARLVLGRKGALWYVLDARADRMDVVELVQDFRRTCAAWPMAKRKFVEDASNGTALLQTVRGEVPGVIAVSPSAHGGKPTRAATSALVAEAGQLFLPSERWVPHIGVFVEQHVSFPAAAHDDFVDALSQALLESSSANRPLTPEDRIARARAMRAAFGG
jgi:predicted phage terminase large subunit-like protein